MSNRKLCCAMLVSTLGFGTHLCYAYVVAALADKQRRPDLARVEHRAESTVQRVVRGHVANTSKPSLPDWRPIGRHRAREVGQVGNAAEGHTAAV